MNTTAPPAELPTADPTARCPQVLVAAAATHVGPVRANNEDDSLITASIALVADGVGGHAGGEVASAVAVTTVRSALQRRPHGGRTVEDVAGAVHAAHDAILSRVAREPRLTGMGTTLTGLVLTDAGAAVVNVGDSRTYRVTSDGQLEQLTRDDTLVADLVDQGVISADFAPFHPRRNVITAALGFDGPDQFGARITIQVLGHARGRYVICSDGFSDPLASGDLPGRAAAAAVDQRYSPQDAADQLVALALAAGTRDNVTVVVADLT